MAGRAGIGDLDHGAAGSLEIGLGVEFPNTCDVQGERATQGTKTEIVGDRVLLQESTGPGHAIQSRLDFDSPAGIRPCGFVHGDGQQGCGALEKALHRRLGRCRR